MKSQYEPAVNHPVPVNTVKDMAQFRNVKYEYRRISTKNLLVDPLYQRTLNTVRVEQMAKEYHPCLVNTVKVSLRNGKYYVFDGAHTMAMLKELNGGRDCVIACKVYSGLTWEDEVDLFIAQNGISRAVHMNDKFKALYNKGDPDVIRLVELADSLNIRIDFSGHRGPNRIVALATLFRIYQSLDESEFLDYLSIIKEAWDGCADSFSNQILRGMYLFYDAYRGLYNRRLLISKLRQVSPMAIIREGKASTYPGASKYAREIVKLYNAGTSRGKQLPDKL